MFSVYIIHNSVIAVSGIILVKEFNIPRLLELKEYSFSSILFLSMLEYNKAYADDRTGQELSGCLIFCLFTLVYSQFFCLI